MGTKFFEYLQSYYHQNKCYHPEIYRHRRPLEEPASRKHAVAVACGDVVEWVKLEYPLQPGCTAGEDCLVVHDRGQPHAELETDADDLCHIFKEGTGFSLMDYVINCRILKARSLLRNGMRVQEVGENVGFRNNEHFIRTFKKLTGTPPKRYAMMYKDSDQNAQRELVVVEGKDGKIIEGIKA